MRSELTRVLDLAQSLPPDELAVLLGELETVRLIAHGRMNSSAVATRPDERIEVKEAARRMGVSASYLYRHASKFPFTRRMGRKVLIDRAGLDAYLKKSR
jgi:excisionase family DNA binding protein